MDLIRTVGHGTLSDVELGDLLEEAGVTTLVDVRRYPGSRRNPQFNTGEMARWLPERGIEYHWMEGLGGRRRVSESSVNTALRNEQFRAYADHMASDEFRHASDELRNLTTVTSVSVMCSESVWWRCHRRLLADHLVLVERKAVEHLFHDGRTGAHPVTPGARRQGDRVVYDVAD
ncbi:MAG TPA: DUF488 domain-containing protein [Acidimicrobiia bacterium]|nr:DUF488 domain-containing protein [Acidimicrobiia bacterium]